MKQSLVNSLLHDILADLQQPAIFWQVAVLLACLGLAWGLSRWLLSLMSAEAGPSEDGNGRAFGMAGLARVLMFPLFALALVAIASPILRNWQNVGLLRMALVLLAALAIIRFSVHALRSALSSSLLDRFEKVLGLLMWGGVALYVTGLWSDVAEFLDAVRLPLGKHAVTVLDLLQGIASVLVALIVALWAGSALEQRLMRAESLDPSLRAVASRLGRAALVLAAVLVSLEMVGLDLTVLSVFGGALGVGLGLGLQRIASNYVSGFIILFDRGLRIGDLVTADKYFGTVTQIKTRYTVIRALDGTEAILPNEMLVSSPVQNHSYSDRKVRVAIKVQVGYGSDLDRALALLVECANSNERVLADPPALATLTDFGADGLNLELGFWITDPEQGTSVVRSDVNRAVLRAFRDNNIEIPYPQREIRLLEDPTGVAPRRGPDAGQA